MVEPLFEKERYIVTYNPTKGKVYALLKDQAKFDDVLKAAFHGHVLLHSIRISVLNKQASIRNNEEVDALCFPETPMDIVVEVAKSCKIVSATYGLFKDKATQEVLISTYLVLYTIHKCKIRSITKVFPSSMVATSFSALTKCLTDTFMVPFGYVYCNNDWKEMY